MVTPGTMLYGIRATPSHPCPRCVATLALLMASATQVLQQPQADSSAALSLSGIASPCRPTLTPPGTAVPS